MKRLHTPLFIVVALLTFFILIPAAQAITVNNLAVSPEEPVTTSTLTCIIQVTGTGTLEANISWYRNGVAWPSNTETLALTSSVNASTTATGSIQPANTTRGQTWRCQAIIGNGTNTLAANSSVVTIQNSAPTITFPLLDQEVFEKSPVSMTATATDADGDSIVTFISSDLNASLYAGVPLFTIASNGGISFTPPKSSVGNHTMALLAYDGQSWGGVNVLFTVIEINNPPVMTNPGNQNATVGTPYNLTIIASDEEGDALNFSLSTTSPGLTLTQLTNLTALLSFAGGAPVPGDIGFFNVNITAYEADNASSNTSILFTMNVTEPNIQPTFTSVPNASATQGDVFEYIVQANDSNSDDTLFFSITSPGCLASSPWTINTTDNTSTSATGIINVTLTNSHIACRNVTITVSDYSVFGVLRSSVSTQILFNLTNTNDAPEIGEMSYYANYLDQRNITNLSAATGRPFTYRVNASDIDMLTYMGDTLTYADNTSLFVINSSTGQISFTPNAIDAGVHLINISVTDLGGLTANRTMRLTIISNTVPQPVNPGTIICQEDAACGFVFSATDPDADENITFTLNNTIISNLTKLTWDTTRFNHTYTNEHVGNYSLTLAATDKWGASNTTNFTLVINNTNDAPFFDSNKDNVSNTLLLPEPVVVGIEKTWDVIATDPDFRNVYENLTFTVDITGPNAALFTINKTAEDRAVIQFTPVGGDLGSYTVNVTVTDLTGAFASDNITFDVIAPGALPEITGLQPYSDGVTQINTTITATVSIASTVSFQENQSIYFNISFTDIDTVPGSMAVYYYWNNVLVHTGIGSSPNYTRYLDFFSSGTHTARVVIEDETLGTDSFEWTVNVENVKRRPIVTGVFPDRIINGTTMLVNEMRFLDPDDDLNSNGNLDDNETNTLVFTPVETGFFDVTYSSRSALVTPVQSGVLTFQYAATTAGNEYAVSGNPVTYSIFVNQEQSSSSSSSSSSSGGGGGGGGGGAPIPRPQPVPDPFVMDIIVPQALTIYDNGTVIAPIALRNTGDITLRDIQLSTATTANVSTQFLADRVNELAPGATFNTSLAIGGYRLGGTFEVVVIATVGDPEFNDSAVIMINSLEKGSAGDAVNTKVTSARDFLTQNPVCGELTQLVDQAQAALARNDLTRAEELLTAVTDGCSYLRTIQAQELQQPGLLMGILGKRSTNIMLGGALLGLLALGAMLVTHYARQE